MNLTAVVLIVICAVLLTVAYALNGVKRTRDERTVLLELTRTRPDTRAMSLGYDRQRRKFRNVVLDQRGNVVVRYDPFPVSETGDYILLRDHGRVDYLDDHYRIDGFPNTKFTCPDGFVGKNCDLQPLCGADDENVYRPLTFRQFNHLRLYDVVGSTSTNADHRRHRRQATEQRHDRIKIHCIAGGRYRLETCQDNELLDENLQCRPYDLCQDRLSGFKHNYPIDDNGDRLADNEYYSCADNRSVLTKCADNDMIFSRFQGTCVVKNQCTDMDDATVRLDDNRYIQCENDTGRTVTCANGIRADDTGRLSCITKLCKPYELTYEDNVFRYMYGRVTCDDATDTPIQQICNVEPYREHTYSYKWAQPFQLTIKNIPNETYVNGLCKTTKNFHDIVRNPVVQLAWSDAMSQTYPFDFVKQEYVCGEDAKFRWDYMRGVTVPQTDEFVDSGAPCQDRSYKPFELPWQNFDTIRYPETGAPIVIGTPTEYTHETDTDSFWPVYLGNDEYQTTLLDVDLEKRQITLSDWVDKVPPQGFRRSTSDKPQLNSLGQARLDLLGVGQPSDEWTGHHRWFVIASGRFAPIRVSESAVKRNETTFAYDGQTIQLNQLEPLKWHLFPVFWEKLDPNGETFKASSFVELSRIEGATFSGAVPKRPGLFPFRVFLDPKGKDDRTEIQIVYRGYQTWQWDVQNPTLLLP